MRILIYEQFFAYDVGGMQVFVRELADYLIAHGHEVSVVCEDRAENPAPSPDQCLASRKEIPLASGVHIPVYRITSNVPHWLDTYMWQVEIWLRIQAQLRPDITHLVLCFPNFSVLPIVATRARTKTAVTIQCGYVPDAEIYDSELTGLIGMFLGRGTLQIDSLYHSVLGNCDAITAVASELCGILTQVIDREITHIPNFVDCEKFCPSGQVFDRASMGLGDTDKVILYAGRMEERKGIHVLVDAFAEVNNRLADTKLVLVGQVEGQMDSARFGRLTSHESIRVVGPQPHEVMPSIYRLCDLFVLPSLGFPEAFNLSLLEAMACGRPVVASDILGLREQVEDEVDGLLVAPNDAVDLREHMMRVLGDQRLATVLGRQARAKAEHYDRDKVLKEYIELYRLLVETPATL